MIPRGFVVFKPGHEETEENLTNFLESRLQVKTDSLRAQAIDKPILRVLATGAAEENLESSIR
jgi:hypothetical protein